MLTRQKKQQETAAAYSRYNSAIQSSIQRRKWIEDNLLQTALNDYKKTIVTLVLAPYLLNIQCLAFEQPSSIIQQWLDLCKTERTLDFNAKHFVNGALIAARKSRYKPMSLSTLKQRNCTLYQRIVCTGQGDRD